VKFTQSGHVAITLTQVYAGDSAARIRFEIEDTGIGISNEKIDLLFEEFTQVDSSTNREYGGTGLGLAISKRLATQLGGDISVSSEINVGSLFSLEVPVRLVDSTSAVSAVAPRHDSIVWLVCPIEKRAASLTESLQQVVGRVVCHSQAQSLQSIAQKDKPSLILVDQPIGESGETYVYRQLTESLSRDRVPVIIMHSVNTVVDKKRLAEFGVKAYLTKPVNTIEMIESIATVLNVGPQSSENTPKVKALPSGYSGTVEQNYRVLLVEDNKVNQIVAIRMLRKLGINNVVIVDNGAKAVEEARQGEFDAIIMDCQMPVMDGYVATGEIRKLGGYARDVPIIAVTADAMEGDRERCLEAGMSDYIAKPVTSAGLGGVLDRFLISGKSQQPQAPATGHRPEPATGSDAVDEDDVA